MNTNCRFLIHTYHFWALMTIFGLQAQARFRGGLVAGLTASQIDGDRSAGYNKLGFQAGLRAVARLKTRTEASMELLYTQRGSQTEIKRDEFNPNFFSLTLNYIEVPVQWHYKDWLIEGDNDSENYYRVSFNFGFSYARFFSFKNDDDNNWLKGLVPDYIKKNDVNLLIGATWMLSRQWGMTFRYNRSLLFMYDPRDWNPSPYDRGWNSHFLCFHSFYLLN
jgi:Outer membrane protein beta-barrel domain